MATTTSITTTYAGEKASGYVSAALLSASTIDNGGITVKPNIKFKEVLKVVSTDDLVKDASCDFTATSTVTLTEKILQPENQQINLQLCKSDFQSDWDAQEMGFSAFDTLPTSFADFLIGHVAAKAAQRNETNIWSGTTATSGQFDGFATLLAVDADLPAANEVTGTTVTAANVIEEIGKVVDAIPSSLYTSEDLYIYVSQNVARAYVRALGGFGAAGLGANGTNALGTQWSNNGALTFDGVKIFVANGLAANTMIAAEKSNLFFGTSLLSDAQEVKVLDMADLDGSQNCRVIMSYSAGVQYAVVADIVTYGIVNAAN